MGSDTMSLKLKEAKIETPNLVVLTLGLLYSSFWFLREVIPSLDRGYWIDEMGTVRVISDSIEKTWALALEQYQSPLYFMLCWAFEKIAGKGEIILRIPSLVCTLAAIFTFSLLIFRKSGLEASLIALALLLLEPQLIIAATDARPYGLGLLMFALFLWNFSFWTDGRTFKKGVLTAIFGALTIACHPFFAIPVFCAFLISIFYLRSLYAVIIPGIVIAALILPLSGKIIYLWNHKHVLEYGGLADATAFYYIVLPSYSIAGLFTGALVARPRFKIPDIQTVRIALLSFVIFLVPPTIMFALEHLVDGSFFLPRYFVASLLGSAGLVAILTATFWRGSKNFLILGCVLLFTIMGRIQFRQGITHEGWREVAATINGRTDLSNLPILLWPGFAEVENITTLNDPAMADRHAIPIKFYSPEKSVTIIPGSFSKKELKIIAEERIRKMCDTHLPFLLIERFKVPEVEEATNSICMSSTGKEGKLIGSFNGVRVLKFSGNE